MEVGLVAVLSTALLIGAMRWLTGLGGVIHSQLAESENLVLERAVDQFAADVRYAQSCRPTGTDSPFQVVTPTLVRMTTLSSSNGGSGGSSTGTPTAAGSIRLVTWSLGDGKVLRAEQQIAVDCSPSEPLDNAGDWVVWSSSIDDGSFFAVIRSGRVVLEGTGSEACQNAFTERCDFDAVQVSLSGEADVLVVKRVIPVP